MQAVDTPLPVAADAPRARLSEDWTAVLIGVALVAAVLLGLRPALPRVAWTSVADLTGTVLTRADGEMNRDDGGQEDEQEERFRAPRAPGALRLHDRPWLVHPAI